MRPAEASSVRCRLHSSCDKASEMLESRDPPVTATTLVPRTVSPSWNFDVTPVSETQMLSSQALPPALDLTLVSLSPKEPPDKGIALRDGLLEADVSDITATSYETLAVLVPAFIPEDSTMVQLPITPAPARHIIVDEATHALDSHAEAPSLP